MASRSLFLPQLPRLHKIDTVSSWTEYKARISWIVSSSVLTRNLQKDIIKSLLLCCLPISEFSPFVYDVNPKTRGTSDWPAPMFSRWWDCLLYETIYVFSYLSFFGEFSFIYKRYTVTAVTITIVMKQSERTLFMPGFGLLIGWRESVSGAVTVNPCLMQTLRSAFIHTHCFAGLHGPYERRRRSRWHEGKGQDCVWQHPSDLRLAQRVRKTPAMHDAVSGLARAKGKFQMPLFCNLRSFMEGVWAKDKVLHYCSILWQGTES